MKVLNMQNALCSLAVLAAFLFANGVARSQDAPALKPAEKSERLTLESADLKSDSPVMKGIASEKKRKPRLPAHYAKVVTDKQRREIYAIQEQYLPMIELLTIRLEKLKAEMHEKVKSVLDDEQRKKIESASEESKSKRRAGTKNDES